MRHGASQSLSRSYDCAMDASEFLQQLARLLLRLLAALVAWPVALWRCAVRRAHLVRLAEQFPGPLALPLIGNVYMIWEGTSRALFVKFLYYWKKHGPLFRAYAGPLLVISSGHQEDLEKVLSANDYNTKSILYLFLKPWLGDGLLLSSGEKWRTRRKLLTPAFHFKILDQFVPVFHSCGDVFVRQLRKRAGAGPFDVWALSKLFTLDVICETTMGVRVNAQINSTSPYVTAVNDISALVYMRGLRPWLYPDFLFRLSSIGRRHKQCLDILHGTTDRVIRERKAEFQKLSEEHKILDVDELGRRRRVAFLDLMLLAARDGRLSDADIREEVDTFMFEGHDTTAAAISFTIFFLSRHPDVQDKILEELEATFDPSKPLEPSIQDLSELKYVEMVLKESMRIYPPVAAVARDITSDLKLESCPLTVPSGTTFFMSFFMMHRNTKVFPDPEKFDPDRFTTEKCAERHPFAYLPFSAGSRNCIGQRFAMLELKSVLAKVVWNFRILPDPDYEPSIIWELITKTDNGISVILEERRRKEL